ncbi:MAG: FliA/WhiG family RNA polymerase sigma factor [Candidatus Cloacimonetes bacterium]|nr:FliA/WhiG family RNA polymerase sigma factor [Candidatus Cloacimonadota bacterium]
MANEATKLWEACRAGDADARERLVADNLALVHHVARKIQRTVGDAVELQDLVSAGTMGLVQAVETFDATRGHAFSTFAAPRIRGAILDELRRWDHAPRSLRRTQRTLAKVTEQLTSELGRVPDASEIADALDVDVATVHTWQARAEEVVHVPLDRPPEPGDHQAAPADYVAGMTAEDIEEGINAQQEARVLRQHLMQLRERERVVLALYYFKQLKLHEIAQVLGLTESRISQIRSKALATLRERMVREMADQS